jgi:hypothetical protein
MKEGWFGGMMHQAEDLTEDKEKECRSQGDPQGDALSCRHSHGHDHVSPSERGLDISISLEYTPLPLFLGYAPGRLFWEGWFLPSIFFLVQLTERPLSLVQH